MWTVGSPRGPGSETAVNEPGRSLDIVQKMLGTCLWFLHIDYAKQIPALSPSNMIAFIYLADALVQRGQMRKPWGQRSVSVLERLGLRA